VRFEPFSVNSLRAQQSIGEIAVKGIVQSGAIPNLNRNRVLGKLKPTGRMRRKALALVPHEVFSAADVRLRFSIAPF
jgi:hypothetical protein